MTSNSFGVPGGPSTFSTAVVGVHTGAAQASCTVYQLPAGKYPVIHGFIGDLVINSTQSVGLGKSPRSAAHGGIHPGRVRASGGGGPEPMRVGDDSRHARGRGGMTPPPLAGSPPSGVCRHRPDQRLFGYRGKAAQGNSE